MTLIAGPSGISRRPRRAGMAHYEELPAKQPASASATRFERASNAFGLSTVMMSTVSRGGPRIPNTEGQKSARPPGQEKERAGLHRPTPSENCGGRRRSGASRAGVKPAARARPAQMTAEPRSYFGVHLGTGAGRTDLRFRRYLLGNVCYNNLESDVQSVVKRQQSRVRILPRCPT